MSNNGPVSSYNDALQYLNNTIEKHVWLICSPKSGSTWLSTVLENLLKFPKVPLVPGYDRREQEADIFPLFFAGIEGKVFSPQQHCRYSKMTDKVANALNSHIILQLRDIFDSVISVCDHLNTDATHGGFPAYIDQGMWDNLSQEDRLWFIVDLVVPWYFNFYIGWYKSPFFNSNKLLKINYNELNSDPVKTVTSILEFISEPRSEAAILDALSISEKQETRKNTAISGRGSELSQEMRNRIISYSRFYPDVDFSYIGLQKCTP